MNADEIKDLIQNEIRTSVTNAIKDSVKDLEAVWTEKFNLITKEVETIKVDQENMFAKLAEEIVYTTEEIQHLDKYSRKENNSTSRRIFPEYSRKENVIIKGIATNKEENKVALIKKSDCNWVWILKTLILAPCTVSTQEMWTQRHQ